MSDLSPEARYADLTEARGVLLNAAARRIPLVSLQAQARALTLWRHNQVEPGSEAQLACVMDLGVFSPIGGHKPALERLRGTATPPPGSPDEAVLNATARFSLFKVGERDARGGLTLHDLCSGEAIWLMDRHLAEASLPGLLLAARLLHADEFALTSGVVVPVDPRVLLHLLENRPHTTGPVGQLVEPRPEDPLVAQLLAEDGVPERLAELGRDPLLAANTYRTVIDLGLLGPVPGR